ncbi:MAG: hypothetical protein IJ897_08405 [Prevotella sp.]|nr:hypothetical protein [Prevotella sp.]
MKKILLIISLCFCISYCDAQVSNKEDLKKFYTEYLSYFVSDGIKTDSIVKNYCTKELYKEWNEVVNEIGLYDPFTNGIFDDEDLMKKTLVVKKEGNEYVVSFNYLTWPDNKTKTESVIIYVNANGKISHTKRPSDGYMIPEK